MKRLVALLVGASLLLTVLTACSTDAKFVPNSQVAIAEVGKLATLNADAVSSSDNKIASDLGMLTRQSFYYIDEKGELVANMTFGSVKVTNQAPFTVAYTIAEGVNWSDGKPVNAEDLALAVIAAKHFDSLHKTSSLASAEFVGQPKATDKTLTLKFSKPIFDWQTALQIDAPAHIITKAAGVQDLLTAESDADLAKLKDSFSSAFSADASKENFLSNGAYEFTSVTANEIQLTAIREFKGLHPALVDKVTFKIFEDNASAFKALSAGGADLFNPLVTLNEPEADLVSQSSALSESTFKVSTADSNLSEQFVMNLGSGIFADATHQDQKLASVLRQAFMQIVPKVRAIDFASLSQVVKPSDSFVYGTFSKNYSGVIASNGSSQFQFQNVEKASESIASKKLARAPMVRVLFDSDNPAAVSEWTMLSDHASSAGFNLTNVSTEDPSEALVTGQYDVYLGALPLIGVGSGSIQQLVNGPARLLASQFEGLSKGFESKVSDASLQALDKKLFELGYGLPMYQIPVLEVVSVRIKGLIADPYGSSVAWGYWTWQVSADK